MKLSRQEQLTKPFVVEEKDLTILCENFRKSFPSLKFEITSKDSLKREFSNLEELLQFENTPATDIRSLLIRGYEGANTLYLRLDNDTTNYNIYVHLDGDEQSTYETSRLIDDRLTAMRPWYAVLPQWPYFGSIVFNLILLYFVLKVIWKVSATIHPNFATSTTAIVVISFINGIIGTAIYFYLIRTFFPKGVFALGQGAKRHKDKEIFRTVVIVALVVSAVAGVITALMMGQ